MGKGNECLTEGPSGEGHEFTTSDPIIWLPHNFMPHFSANAGIDLQILKIVHGRLRYT